MNQWLSILTGSGATGIPILMLVLTGRLIPVWVVRKQVDATLEAAKSSITSLEASHQRELTSKDEAHADALALRDREAERLAQQTAYEREAKDIERSRSDAATGRLGDLAAEFGGNHRKLVEAVEAAARDR